MANRWIACAALILVCLVLTVAGLLQIVPIRDVQRGDQARPPVPADLAEIIPREIAGWTVRDEPLGPSEFVQDAVAKNLNYDDYVYRIYQRGGRYFGVYVAYWSPGRMPVQKVASHTPDRCWTENGWVCTEMRFAETIPLLRTDGRGQRTEDGEGNAQRPSADDMSRTSEDGLEAGESVVGESVNRSMESPSHRVTELPSHRVTELKPAQWRRFTSPNGGTQYVLFWHLIGGEPYDYGTRFNDSPHPLKWWRDTVKYAFQGSQEQYFIRLTSDRPFEELQDEPGFRAILAALGRIGLDDGEAVVGEAVNQ